MCYSNRYTGEGVYTIYESDGYDPYGDDPRQLCWDHLRFPGQWSLRYSSFPISPSDEPTESCLSQPGAS